MYYCRHGSRILALAGLLAGTAGNGYAQSAIRCGSTAITAGNVTRVIDGRTFVLDDGREVRLAAIEVPSGTRPEQSVSDPEGAAAREQLASLLATGVLGLRRAETDTDRYGRVPAYAFVVQAGTERSLQADMLAEGHARVAATVGSRDCAADLEAREKDARKAKLGLWGDPYYGMQEAEKPIEILARRGHFALVEGKVLSVRESGATIYVNFGRRWSDDFTVTILKRNARRFTAAGLDPKSLSGKQIRVRGWIEERGGPWIEATQPEQIELAVGD
jgi:endonuclease YncB( thermonuclease family)